MELCYNKLVCLVVQATDASKEAPYMHYDIAIIGAGEAGVFAGYELMKLRPDLSMLIKEQGQRICWGHGVSTLERKTT